MAGRLYTMVLDAISVTTDADQDVWSLGTAATKQLVLHEFRVSATTSAEEPLRMQLVRRTAVGSGGSAGTITALDQGNAFTAVTTGRLLDTTPGTGTTLLDAMEWNQKGEYLYLPTPETRIVLSASSFLSLHIQTAAGGTRTWSGSVKFEEV